MVDPKVIENFNKLQNCGHLHPLTCGNNSSHAVLKLDIVNDKIVGLVCSDCDYKQSYIPSIVLNLSEELLNDPFKDTFHFIGNHPPH